MGIEATEEEIEQYRKELSKGKKGFIHKVDFINKVQSLMPEKDNEVAALVEAFKVFNRSGNGMVTA